VLTDAENHTTSFTYNPAGQPLTITDPLSNVMTFTYALGDLIKVNDPLNRETQRILDAAGRLRNVTNPLGQTTLYTPDALDRITQLTDAISGATAFTYDDNSNLLTVTDAKTQQTVYTYSNMNRTATRKDPLVNTETYTYDNNGNVATVTDRKNQVTTNTYDALNRKTKTTFHDSTSTNYTYDAGNRVTQVQEKDSGGTVTATITRTYDGLDRLTQEVTAQGQLDYVYDNASRRTSMTVAGQTAVTYSYDNANRLTQVQQGTSTVTMAYDDADRRTSLTLPNGNSLTYAYDAASQITSLTYKQGATVIGDLSYTYDAAGNRTKVGGALARVTIPPALSTVSYNANNQQTTFGTNTETYDLNGNLSTVTDASGTATYSWNARNQLTGISAAGFAASFTYDSFWRRTGRTVQGVATNFVYDGLNPVQEKAGSTVTANLLTGLGIDEFFQRTDGVGTSTLLPDALGSTVALGANTGTLQTQYTYEPFGYATTSGTASANTHRYTGREDDGTGLYYYRARYYHPRLQRFIEEDPIGFAGGINKYAYTLNNPIIRKDPHGLWIPQAIGTVVGAGFGAYGAYANDPNASLKTIIQSAAVGGAAGLFSTLPIPGVNLAVSGFTFGGIGGAAGNWMTQLLLPPSSCSKRIEWTSVYIAGVTGAVGGLGGATAASITSGHGMPILTDLGQQAVSGAIGGIMGGLLDAIYQGQYQAQTGSLVTP
jgi:RHS repeat-associated protein